MSLRYFTILALSATLVTVAVEVRAQSAARPGGVTAEGTPGEAEGAAGTADTCRYGLESTHGHGPGVWVGCGYGPGTMGGHWSGIMGR